MNVLIIGGGGREHAIAAAIKRSPRLGQLHCAPGNAGTAAIAENRGIDPLDFNGLIALAKSKDIGLTIVGPEAPLCAGIVDRFQQEGLSIFGPSAAAARIEGDKAWAKALMHKCRVPTAEGRSFTDYRRAREYVATRDTPQVVKAAGLAAGKGVVVCDDPSDALLALEAIMVDQRHGGAGSTVVVEERLKGVEASILALIDGNTIYLLESAQDHKSLLDGDQGPNTGGMGAYSPTPFVTDSILDAVQREVLVPIVDGLRHEDSPYRGVLYVGLMLTPGGPKVLEFNCRFGDPETQAILHRLKGDPLDMFQATVEGSLDSLTLEWDPRPSVCVVMAANGYPEQYAKGMKIEGISNAEAFEGVSVYHAGTRRVGGDVQACGGRVLGVTASGTTIAEAQRHAYEAVKHISFEGAVYRTDIASKAFRESGHSRAV